jgi:hypothetical protein
MLTPCSVSTGQIGSMPPLKWSRCPAAAAQAGFLDYDWLVGSGPDGVVRRLRLRLVEGHPGLCDGVRRGVALATITSPWMARVLTALGGDEPESGAAGPGRWPNAAPPAPR